MHTILQFLLPVLVWDREYHSQLVQMYVQVCVNISQYTHTFPTCMHCEAIQISRWGILEREKEPRLVTSVAA